MLLCSNLSDKTVPPRIIVQYIAWFRLQVFSLIVTYLTLMVQLKPPHLNKMSASVNMSTLLP